MTKKSITNLKRTVVVSVMGHVDHGKTSLLDAIMGTRVQLGEAGGITQNTRTHKVEYKGNNITFIDTPGHEAFSAMRSRGAHITDIVLLVVAADDGVQPQTKESIRFAKEANVPILVVINKIDLKTAKVKKIKNELSQFDVLIEEFGGDSMLVEVSALKNKGIKELLDTILLQAEMLELTKRKVTRGTAEAIVIESYLDKTKGPVLTILIQAGEIKKTDYIIYPNEYKKTRSIMNEFNKEIDTAKEGDSVQLIGSDKVLATGEQLLFESNKKKAELLVKQLEIKEKGPEAKIENENNEEVDDLSILSHLLDDADTAKEIKDLNIVIRTDTQGTLEAVLQKVIGMKYDEVKINILFSGTGSITQKDVSLAKDSGGIILGFQTNISKSVETIIKREKVLVRNYTIIYQLIDELNAVIQSMIDPEEEFVELAKAKVKKIFTLNNGKNIAGCKVLKGKVTKGVQCLVQRGDEEVGNGKITSLKQGKEEVSKIEKGKECGILIEPEIEIEEGDEIICYKLIT